MASAIALNSEQHLFVKLKIWFVGLVFVSFAARHVIGQGISVDTTGIVATIENFHRALRQGDRDAALAVLAEDATILESGESQTRAEYERDHLGEDIKFARATTTEHSPLVVQQEGSVAWSIATTKTTGTFKGHKINSAGVELMVLTKNETGWRIRAIHWSSHAAK